MKNKKLTFITLFMLVLSAALLIGCAPAQTAAIQQIETPVPYTLTGGVLNLKINPEIALHYDETGKVTMLEGRNADGKELIRSYTGYVGKDTTVVLSELVEQIGKAGYFVEDADGKARQIILELDPGSQLPNDTFLEDMAAHVKFCVESKIWIGEREYEYAGTLATAPAETIAPTEPTSAQPAAPSSSTRCPVCYDDDCNDGQYCDDWDDRAENEREAERRKSGTPCTVCGDYDCDDGKYCDDWDDRYDDNRDNGNHHRRHHDG